MVDGTTMGQVYHVEGPYLCELPVQTLITYPTSREGVLEGTVHQGAENRPHFDDQEIQIAMAYLRLEGLEE